jgi:MFS transporter, FHS family, glucose/mannose:H+ symporter
MKNELPNPRETSSTRRKGLFLVHVAFVLTGVITTLLGPMLPVLSARWALNDKQAGYLFTAQFISSTVGVAISGLVIRRCGYRAVMTIGLGAMALGAVVLWHAGWLGGIVSVCIYGLGIGFISPTANLVVAELSPGNRAAALNLLNFSWGLGAVGCPFAVAFLVVSHHALFFMYVLATALALVALIFFMTPFFMTPFAELRAPQSQDKHAHPNGLWHSPIIVIFGLLFFLYVGAENCISGWIASYTQRMQNSAGAFWALTPSLFWAALLIGRATAPGMLRRIEEKRLASIGLLVASGGVVCLLIARTIGTVSIGAAIAGFGLASVFPICIALMSRQFGEMAPRAAGLLFALAGLGGATLPNLVGLLSTRLNSLRIGLGVPLLSSLLMLVLFSLLDRTAGERTPSKTRATSSGQVAA